MYAGAQTRYKGVVKIKDLINSTCDTGSVRGLSLQIIHQMNQLVPGLLIELVHPRVSAEQRVNLYMQSAAHSSMLRVLDERCGEKLQIISCYRTIPQQLLLYRWYKSGRCGIPLAAKPSRSNHEDAAAVDVGQTAAWRQAFRKHGWVWEGPDDPAHYSYRGPGFRDDVGNIGLRAFQTLWNKHNLTSPLQADGLYGPRTEAALLESPANGW